MLPYSIVPGGVESREELQAAMESDPLVASHYAGVAVGKLKPVTLARDTSAYVSFRMADTVYWTAHKVRLAKGERVFEGGEIGVRGRCGNQVSEQPRTPVLPNVNLEPTSEILSTPVPATQPAGLLSAVPSWLSAGLHQAETGERPSLQMEVGPGTPGIYAVGGSGGVVAVGGSGGGGGGVGGGGVGGVAAGQTGITPSLVGSSGILPPTSAVYPSVAPVSYAIFPPPTSFTGSGNPLPPVTILPPTLVRPGTPPVVIWQPPVDIPVVPPVTPPGTPVIPPVIPPIVVTPPTPPGTPGVPPMTPPTTPPGKPLSPVEAVPEPATWMLLGSALLGFWWRRRSCRLRSTPSA